jgi:hypothetical protein
MTAKKPITKKEALTSKKPMTRKAVPNGTSKTATREKSVQNQSTARKIVTIKPALTKSGGESTTDALLQRVIARVLPGMPPRDEKVPQAAVVPDVVDLTSPRSAKRSREDSGSDDTKPMIANKKQGSSMFVPPIRPRPPSVVHRTEGKRSEAKRASEQGNTQWMNVRVRITDRIYHGETGLVIDHDGDLCQVQLDSRDKPVRIFTNLLKREPTQSNKPGKDHVGASVAAKKTAEERFECIVCTDVKAAAAFGPAITAQCSHPRRVCQECMANTIHMEVTGKGNFGDILCPHKLDGCCATLAYADIQREAHKEDFERYDSTLARRAMEEDVGFRWCAHGCGNGHFLHATGPNTHFQCQHCKKRTCAHHRCAWHSGRSCADYDADARKSEEVALLQYLEQEGTVRCPKCNHGIEKRSGCDHMTCSKRASGCGAEFCFRCGADYKGPRGIFALGNHAHKPSCRHYFPPPL